MVIDVVDARVTHRSDVRSVYDHDVPPRMPDVPDAMRAVPDDLHAVRVRRIGDHDLGGDGRG
jgi:hypothetical protein